MFAWETVGKKVFKNALPSDMFAPTKGLAANQGLYNGFLAAGLIWSLLIGDAHWSSNVAIFFLGCVLVAGLYGGLTASRSILLKQALPAAIALVCADCQNLAMLTYGFIVGLSCVLFIIMCMLRSEQTGLFKGQLLC